MPITLKATARSRSGKKPSQLRREGLIPAVLFGKGMESQEISVPALDFSRMEHRITNTTLLDVVVDGSAPVPALLHKVQTDPRSSKPVHLELHRVRMEDKIQVNVPVQPEGTAPAVTDRGGTLILAHEMVSVRCSPDHLFTAFHVNVSHLADFDQHVTAGDLQIPEGVELLTDPSTILISVMPPRVQEEELGAPEELAEPELIGGRGKPAGGEA